MFFSFLFIGVLHFFCEEKNRVINYHVYINYSNSCAFVFRFRVFFSSSSRLSFYYAFVLLYCISEFRIFNILFISLIFFFGVLCTRTISFVWSALQAKELDVCKRKIYRDRHDVVRVELFKSVHTSVGFSFLTHNLEVLWYYR